MSKAFAIYKPGNYECLLLMVLIELSEVEKNIPYHVPGIHVASNIL